VKTHVFATPDFDPFFRLVPKSQTPPFLGVPPLFWGGIPGGYPNLECFRLFLGGGSKYTPKMGFFAHFWGGVGGYPGSGRLRLFLGGEGGVDSYRVLNRFRLFLGRGSFLPYLGGGGGGFRLFLGGGAKKCVFNHGGTQKVTILAKIPYVLG